MNPDLIFQFANTFVLIGWILLIFFPKWPHTIMMSRTFVVVPLGLLYAFLVLSSIAAFDPNQFSTLAGVKALFADDLAVVVGWIHYLAFDLFVGTYIVSEGVKLKMNRVLYTICLPFTFMFGPVGLLLFMLLKFIHLKKSK